MAFRFFFYSATDESLSKLTKNKSLMRKNYGKNMAVDSRAGRFSFEWGCTDMAAGKTLDGRTPRICPIYATDKLRNMGKNLEKSESVLYCCRRNGRGNRLFTVVYEWLERVLIL